MRSSQLAHESGCSVGDAYQQIGYRADSRSFLGAAAVVAALGIESVRMMTNNPDKASALEHAGISVELLQTVVSEAEGPWLREYYAKKATEGHSVLTGSVDQ
jgi:3,4-dihydroxy 2-butanone 4-phosphate synthase / GTP cyclohydrolase II